jgi:hypothetical protein
MKSETPGDMSSLLQPGEPDPAQVPAGVDRRTFMMRSAVIGWAAVIPGCTPTEKQQTAAASAPPPALPKGVSLDLDEGPIHGGRFWRLTPMVNWYLSDHLRLELAYGVGQLDRFGVVGTTQFFQSRLQFQF